MSKKYLTEHIGECRKTKKVLGGYKCCIVDGGKQDGYVVVRIKDVEFEAKYINFRTRNIRYPFHKSVYGIGYLGIGKYKPKQDGRTTKEYNIWSGMMTRCYNPKYHENKPTYKNVTVCEEWHNFQNFAKWFEDNYIDGWEIDKDLLSGDSKIYSPKTCVFIPRGLNGFLANSQIKNKNFTGVSFHKRVKKWQCRINDASTHKIINLGYFDTKEEALERYKEARNKMAEYWRSKMWGFLSDQAIENIK